MVLVAMGGVSSWVGRVVGEGASVPALGELVLDGIAVGGMSILARSLVQKIQPIPRIETTPMAIGIRSARSNEGRGCIPDKVLPRFYPHSFRWAVRFFLLDTGRKYRSFGRDAFYRETVSSARTIFIRNSERSL